jgi:two-component system LytT family sensor kinase
MEKTERRIWWYSSILIGLMMSSPRLLALRENGIIAHYWRFNLAEFVMQMVFNIGFCCFLFYLNLTEGNGLAFLRHNKKYSWYYALNGTVMLVCCTVMGSIQRGCFMNEQLPKVYWSGYLTRFFLSTLLTGIIIKIIMLLRESKQKDKVNPHFLFNSLSSLSGIIREDPEKAQHFISHLSKIFRYSLARSQNHLVSIGDELIMIKSYEELLKMRFEKAFQLEIMVDVRYMGGMMPHLSLQPLLENAAKHNIASLTKPLKVKIYVSDHNLVVSNNLQEITSPENSTGIGLVNLNSRFRILMHKEIEIEKTNGSFIVKLPVIA